MMKKYAITVQLSIIISVNISFSWLFFLAVFGKNIVSLQSQ